MDKGSNPSCYLGTSNIVLPVANKQLFPEAFRNKSRLTYYSSLFNSLEVNSSFYKIPLAKTIIRWASEVPGNFRFTFKMNKDITHDKTMSCDPYKIERFMQIINNAGQKKGSLLIQFPAGRQYNLEYLKNLLFIVQQNNEGWDVCVEFRHLSWYRDTTYRLLETSKTTIVIHDMSKSATPSDALWGNVIYLRFHGPKGDYKGGYGIDTLKGYADKIKSWLKNKKIIYTYFNNTMGSAVFDALVLQELVGSKIIHQI